MVSGRTYLTPHEKEENGERKNTRMEVCFESFRNYSSKSFALLSAGIGGRALVISSCKQREQVSSAQCSHSQNKIIIQRGLTLSYLFAI